LLLYYEFAGLGGEGNESSSLVQTRDTVKKNIFSWEKACLVTPAALVTDA